MPPLWVCPSTLQWCKIDDEAIYNTTLEITHVLVRTLYKGSQIISFIMPSPPVPKSSHPTRSPSIVLDYRVGTPSMASFDFASSLDAMNAHPAPQKRLWKENLNYHETCPECKEFPPNLAEEFSSGDMVCDSCGLVLGPRIIDTRSEWRTITDGDGAAPIDPSRVGAAPNILLHGSQLRTTVSSTGMMNRELLIATRKLVDINDKSNKKLLEAYVQISTLCDGFQLPTNVSDTAKHYYKLIQEAKVCRGRKLDVVLASCIFIACRHCSVTRTFQEVFSLTKVSKPEIARTFDHLKRFFEVYNRKKKMERSAEAGGASSSPAGNSINSATNTAKNHNQQNDFNEGEVDIGLTKSRAELLCGRFCSNLGLQYKCTPVSEELCRRASDMTVLASRSPLSIAGACIYAVSHLMGDEKTAKETAEVVGSTQATIKIIYKIMWAHRKDLLKDLKGPGGVIFTAKALPRY